DLKPVAWHRDSEMVRMKLGLYHSIHNVGLPTLPYLDACLQKEASRADSCLSPLHSIRLRTPLLGNSPLQLLMWRIYGGGGPRSHLPGHFDRGTERHHPDKPPQ
ncbi:unnamed protein product, partial [Ectocarpus sp. 12 AP-2014]